MERADWLRDRMRSYGCGACGWGFEPEQVRIRAEREGLYFLELGCAMCGHATDAIVSVEVVEPDAASVDAPELAPRVPDDGPAPVDADDLLRVHAILDSLGDRGVDELLRRLDGAGGPVGR